MRIYRHRDRWALLIFDGRVRLKGAERRKCALHLLHTTTATTKSVKYLLMIILMVARCRNSMVAFYACILGGGDAPYTCDTRRPQRPSMLNA